MRSMGGHGLLGALADHDALAGREPVRLDDDGRALRSHAGRIEVVAREACIAGRRYAVAHQEFLGERLAALEPRGARRGPKHFRPRASNASTMPATSGPSGPTIESATASRPASASRPDVIGRHVHVAALRLPRGSRVPRRDQHFAHARRLRQFPRRERARDLRCR